MNEKELLRLQKEIEGAKTLLAELSGKEKHLKEELANVWGCKTLVQARKKLEEMESEIRKIDTQIDTLSIELEDELDKIADNE